MVGGAHELEGGSPGHFCVAPSLSPERSPESSGFFFKLPLPRERGCGKNSQAGAGMLEGPGLSVYVAWPCTQQGLVNYTLP